MKKSKFTGEQIAFVLRQAEVGTPVVEVCRKMGVSEATYYRWKQLYGGPEPSELRKMRHLEEENQKLKRLVADLSLDKAMLQEVLAKKCSAWSTARDRPWVQDRYRVTERRSCAVLRFDRKTHRYRSIRSDQAPLRNRIKEIAATRVRYGYRRIHVLLRREGWAVNGTHPAGLSITHKWSQA